MIVDSSAVIALIAGEPAAPRLSATLAKSPASAMSAASYVECAIVLQARGGQALVRRLDALLRIAGVRIEPVTVSQAQIAVQAFHQFGRGSGSAARLNFGDCFTYALAAETGEPLLYVGDDFDATDLVSALS